MPTRAALYLRVSKDNGSQTVENQGNPSTRGVIRPLHGDLRPWDASGYGEESIERIG